MRCKLNYNEYVVDIIANESIMRREMKLCQQIF